jgi:hypothetical protein
LQRLLTALPADITRDVVARAMHDATSTAAARNGAVTLVSQAQRMVHILESYRAVEDHRAPQDAGTDAVMVTDDGQWVIEAKRSGKSGPQDALGVAPTPSPPPRPPSGTRSTRSPAFLLSPVHHPPPPHQHARHHHRPRQGTRIADR